MLITVRRLIKERVCSSLHIYSRMLSEAEEVNFGVILSVVVKKTGNRQSI